MSGSPQRTHYQVLGVAPDARLEEIRRAHRQLARVLHPDRLGAATEAERRLAERRMREVNAAWTVLSNPEQRRRYDLGLAAPSAPSGAAGARSGSAAGSTGASGPNGSSRPGGAAPPPWVDPAPRSGHGGDDLALDDEVELARWHFWLLRRGPVIAALVIAAGIFIFTAYAGTTDDHGTQNPTVPPPEHCARVLEGRTAVPVSCSLPNNGRIVTSVDRALDCPAGTRYVLIEQQFVCVDGDAGQTTGG